MKNLKRFDLYISDDLREIIKIESQKRSLTMNGFIKVCIDYYLRKEALLYTTKIIND